MLPDCRSTKALAKAIGCKVSDPSATGSPMSGPGSAFATARIPVLRTMR